MDDAMQHAARSAIDRLERLLDHGPEATHAEVNAAFDCVVAFRNLAIERHRAGAVPQACLDAANALVSLAFGVQFPLSGYHRDRIEQTRDGMRALLAPAFGEAAPGG